MKSINFVDATRERFEAWLLKANLSTGSKLPSERELCELLETKRMTLRQVLIELEAEARIFRKNRSGWFITPSKFIYNPKSLSSFNAEAISQGRQPSWGYLDQTLAQSLPPEVKKTFSLEKGDVYKMTGWGGLDNHKVFYHDSYIDGDFAPDFIHKLKMQSFAKVWEQEYGESLTIKKLSFKPVSMPDFACKELGVASGSFGILIEKHRATSKKKVVQIDLEYWRFEFVELVIDDL